MSLVAALLVAAPATCVVPAAEEVAQRALPYAAFDSRTGPYGWRVLAAAGCTDTAVSLLARYVETNRERLAPTERRELAFHIGQALAMAGRESEAIAPFEQALDAEAPAEWATYVKATLAFLRRDRAALEEARAAYASLAPGLAAPAHHRRPARLPTERYMKAAHCRM